MRYIQYINPSLVTKKMKKKNRLITKKINKYNGKSDNLYTKLKYKKHASLTQHARYFDSVLQNNKIILYINSRPMLNIS